MKYLKAFESIRDKYQEYGPASYYQNHASEYQNPHTERIEKGLDYIIKNVKIGNFLDLGCGNGIVSEYLNKKGFRDFEGCDPYFSKIYKSKFDKNCLSLSFEDISTNGLDNKYDTIICSYAIHLCPKS